MNQEDRDLHYIRLRKNKIVFGFHGEKEHYTFHFGFGSRICDIHKTSGAKSETKWAARYDDLIDIMQEVSLDELIQDLLIALMPVDYTWLYEGNIWLAESFNEEEISLQLDKNTLPVAMNNLGPCIRPLPSGLLINRLCQNVDRKYIVYQKEDEGLSYKGVLLQWKGEQSQPFVEYVDADQLTQIIERYSEQSIAVLNLFTPEVKDELARYLNDQKCC